MHLVLDSNEFLFAFGVGVEPASVALLDALAEQTSVHRVHIPRLIINEIRRNLPNNIFHEVLTFIQDLTRIDEDFIVPFELGIKYERAGLKPADAFIAAYAEWVGADCLVSENRHFLTRHKGLPFRIVTAVECLTLLR